MPLSSIHDLADRFHPMVNAGDFFHTALVRLYLLGAGTSACSNIIYDIKKIVSKAIDDKPYRKYL